MCAKENNKKQAKCPHCNANMYVHGHRLSKGLVDSLIKFKTMVLELNENKVHIKDQLSLTKTAFNNFQKLRYHGLVAKYIDSETDEHLAGYWLLTKRGNQFLKNELSLPVVVYTFRNKIIDKHKDLVKLQDVLKDNSMPYWDEKSDFIVDYADLHDIEEMNFDSVGQGLLFK